MNITSWQWLIILGIVVLLFGAAKLPKLARSLGESARIFRSEVETIRKAEADQDETPGEASLGGGGIGVKPDVPQSSTSNVRR